MSRNDAMPVFVIKATDALAPEAVEAYYELCIRYGLDEQAAQVQLALEEIRDWQNRNDDELTLPSHKHVPVGERR